MLTNNDNHVPTRGHDRLSTTKIQSSLDGIDEGEGQIVDHGTRRVTKTIFVIDDDKNITSTVKSSLESENNSPSNRIFFQVDTHNFPLIALSEFKPHFYDLLLIDVEMPKMNGFDLSSKIVELDANPKICFMSAAEVNDEALTEIYPSVGFGCFIKKPFSLEYLINRVRTELDLASEIG